LLISVLSSPAGSMRLTDFVPGLCTWKALLVGDPWGLMLGDSAVDWPAAAIVGLLPQPHF